MKRILSIILFVVISTVFIAPVIVNAQSTPQTQTVPRGDPVTCDGFWDKISVNCLFVGIQNLVLHISSSALWVAGLLFNISIDYGLNIHDLLENIPIVSASWTIFRDLANMTFIFILLYAAINIILGTNGYNIKTILTKVILVAVFINFSLFFTKLTVDLSNIVALQFYAKMLKGVDTSAADNGISSKFVEGLGLTTIYKDSSTKNNALVNYENTVVQSLVVAILASIFMIVTAFVLGAAAIMFVIRSAILIFLMIMSPLAFAAMVIPGMEEHFQKWKKTLFSQAFFAPIYMALFYTIVATISGSFGEELVKKELSFADFLVGQGSMIGIVFSFTILTILMLGCLLIAAKYGAVGGNFASKWGRAIAMKPLNMLGSGAKGLGSNLSYRLANSNMLNAMAGSSVGRLLGGGAILRAANSGSSLYRKNIKGKKDRITETADLIKNRDIRKNFRESYADYEVRKKSLEKVSGDRANNALGLTNDGKSSRDGFFGVSNAERIAQKQVIAAKIKESKSKENDKNEVIEKRLRKMIYGEGHDPDNKIKVEDMKYVKGDTSAAGSALSEIDKDIDDIKKEFDDSKDEKSTRFAQIKLENALRKRDAMIALVDELKSQHKIEQEKVTKALENLGKDIKTK